MKMKNIIQIFLIGLIVFIALLNINNIVFAKEDVISNPGYFDPSKSEMGDTTELEQKTGVVLGVINVVGILISVISLMVMGIKYMLGSIEEKAEYKKTMGIYLLGAFLVFSMTTIPNILYKIGTSI